MRAVIRSLWIVVLALVGTVGVVVAWTTATAVQLAATALIMGGTDHPLSTPPDDPVTFIDPYMDTAIAYIDAAAGLPTGTGGEPISTVEEGDDRYAVIYPAEFFPVFGSRTFDESVSVGFDNLNSCVRGTGCIYNDSEVLDPPEEAPGPGGDFVIFGYSQSAVVASLVKRDLIENRPAAPTDASFFLLANPMRPNGGILARGPEGLTIPILGVTFHGATPTNSCESPGPCYETVDLAAQYDGLGGDAPASLTNVLAILNAAAGYYYLHGNLQNEQFDEDVKYQGSFGDTDYYILPAERLPILMPFEGFVPSPILTAFEAPLKAAIEGAYARDVNPGIATGVGLLPFRDPVQAIINILVAIPTGIDDALAEAAGDPTFRPLGTAPVTSPFGVGGPQLPEPPEEMAMTMAAGGSVEDDATGAEADVVSRNDVDPEALDSGESVEEEVVEEEEVLEDEGLGEDVGAGEEEADEEAAEEEEAEVNTSPATEPEQPKLRGPVEFDSREPTQAPSTAEPATGQTTTGEPESTSGDDEGQAAA